MSTTFKLILLRFSPFGYGIFYITTTLLLFRRKTNTEICALWIVIPWNPSRRPLSPNQSEGSLLKCSEVFIEVAKSDRRALGHAEVTLKTVSIPWWQYCRWWKEQKQYWRCWKERRQYCRWWIEKKQYCRWWKETKNNIADDEKKNNNIADVEKKEDNIADI